MLGVVKDVYSKWEGCNNLEHNPYRSLQLMDQTQKQEFEY